MTSAAKFSKSTTTRSCRRVVAGRRERDHVADLDRPRLGRRRQAQLRPLQVEQQPERAAGSRRRPRGRRPRAAAGRRDRRASSSAARSPAPAATSRSSTPGASVAGPSVATILVRRSSIGRSVASNPPATRCVGSRGGSLNNTGGRDERRALGLAAAAARWRSRRRRRRRRRHRGRSGARGAGRSRPGSRSRCRWSSSATTTSSCSRSRRARSSGSTATRRRRGRLDLTVNSASERGLLGIALDKYFRHNGFVYLYWSETTLAARTTPIVGAVPVLGNRLDRYKWDGTTLTFDKTLLQMRVLPGRRPASRCAATTTAASCASGPDGKVYLIVGDTGRRGQMQNLVDGPFVYPFPWTRRRDDRRRRLRRARIPTRGISPA